uniref:Uncharacterized protein n=1 Tax=Anopheles minimus TaxID=112268 RepID=A0A182WN89_9DIPT
MKVVLLLICFVAMASALVVLRTPTMRQFCRYDDLMCILNQPGGPGGFRALNSANMGRLD